MSKRELKILSMLAVAERLHEIPPEDLTCGERLEAKKLLRWYFFSDLYRA